MTRDGLIRSLVDKKRHVSYKDMSVAVKHIIDTMVLSLSRGSRIEVRGFGTFSVRERASRLARNPRSGVTITIGESNALHFKPGKELKERVNDTRR